MLFHPPRCVAISLYTVLSAAPVSPSLPSGDAPHDPFAVTSGSAVFGVVGTSGAADLQLLMRLQSERSFIHTYGAAAGAAANASTGR